MTDTETRTVATFDEFVDLARNWPDTHHAPTADATGAFAEQIRARLGVATESPVRLVLGFDLSQHCDVLVFHCRTCDSWPDVAFRVNRRENEYDNARAWLEGRDA
ncbi:hypothetical protein ACFYY5_29130 [Nocardia elegans]|uniref:Uncharacterized protein n=1 Tax=Nocardia elegans TaxID=300029 RepID=A0ABW6TPN9_9NOCA